MANDVRPTLDPVVLRNWAVTLRGPVIFAGDDAYDSARLVWNRAVDVQPAAIARAADVDDVVRTLAFGAEVGVSIAVRSGGHSQAGHGTCDGGIVLDLGGFRGVAVDTSAGVARVASGSRVIDVFDAMHAHHVVTPMGGCPDVGVGGLTLGGGENFLMGKYGAVVDNLLGATVVTADGQVLTANADEHVDLFWALRGGGGNFGVVTSFEYRLHAVDEILFGQLTFPLSQARDALRRYRGLMRDASDELQTSGGLAPMPDGPAFFITIGYCGDRRSGEALRARWLSTLRPASDSLRWMTYSADMAVPAAASVGTGLFLTEMSDDGIAQLSDAVMHAPPQASVVWNDFHGAVTRVPLDVTAFPLRRCGFDLFISVPWHTQDQRATAIAWSSGLADALRPSACGVYINNLNETEGDRVREAYGPHYDRLAAIKARYDPANLLRINHNIAPVGGW